MITVFNRKELCTTRNLKHQGQVRDALRAAGIPYKVSASPIASLRYRRGGTLGIQSESLYQYKIYVHKRDYARAQFLLRQK